jgi:hypothetical protein
LEEHQGLHVDELVAPFAVGFLGAEINGLFHPCQFYYLHVLLENAERPIADDDPTTAEEQV